jgi:hypothetical protein
MIAHRPLSQQVRLAADTRDTLRVRLTYDESSLIRDCISPDGRSFGSQFCRDR